MARQEEIIIEVEVNAGDAAQKLAEAKNNISKLKAEQKSLNDSIKKNGKVTEVQAEKLAQINGELKDLSKTEKMYTAQIQLATQNDKKYGDSIIELGGQLAQLKLEYRSLSKQERESAAGKEMLKSIQALDHEVKQLDVSLGDNQRLVGDYTSFLFGVNGQVLKLANLFQGGFRKGLETVGAQLKAFGKAILTTPLGWFAAAAAAVTAILGKLKNAFKTNDEAGTALSAAMARLQPIMDAINKVFSNLAEGVAKFVNAATKAVTFVLEKMVPGYDQAANAARRLKIAQDELEDKENQYVVNHAKYQREISNLRYKAAQRDKYTREQRLQFYDEALALEERDLKEKKRNAAIAYNLALKEAAQTRHVAKLTKSEYAKLDQSIKNNLAQLEANYINVGKEMDDFNSGIEKRRQSLMKEMENEDKAAVTAAKENAKEYAAAIVEGMKKAEEELRKLEDLQNDLIEDELDRQRAIVKTMAGREIKDLEERLLNETNLTEEARKSMSERIVLIRQKMWKDLAAIDDEWLKRVQDTILTSENEAEERAEAARRQAREKYENETESISNSFQERVNAAYGNAVKISEIELEVAQSNYDRLKAMDAETKDALGLSEEAYMNAVLQAEAQIMEARTKNEEALKSQAEEVKQTMQSVTSAMSDLFEAVAGDSEAYEKFKKAMAIADAAISLAQTIAAATSVSASQGDPYTMAIRIASNVAAVTAQFAAVVKAIKAASIPSAPKFAEGGVVPGTSYTGDRVLIRANSGERVLTKEMSDNLVKMLAQGVPTWGMDYERLEHAFVRAASRVPAPVLDYSEFVAYGRKVAMEKEKMMEY